MLRLVITLLALLDLIDKLLGHTLLVGILHVNEEVTLLYAPMVRMSDVHTVARQHITL